MSEYDLTQAVEDHIKTAFNEGGTGTFWPNLVAFALGIEEAQAFAVLQILHAQNKLCGRVSYYSDTGDSVWECSIDSKQPLQAVGVLTEASVECSVTYFQLSPTWKNELNAQRAQL